MKKKLTSRKFWICVAAFLGSVATSVSGIATDNRYVTTVGIVAGILSAAIYAFCEAWVDGKAVTKNAADDYIKCILSILEGNNTSNEDVTEGEK